MTKEQAEKIAEMIADDIHLTYDPYYSPVFKEKIVNILLTATSVKVPSEIPEEEKDKIIKEIAKKRFDSYIYTRDNFDMPLRKLDCEVFSEMEFACNKAFEAGISWAIDKIRESHDTKSNT